MSKRLTCAGALLAAVVCAAAAAAKPPDLPVNLDDWFAPAEAVSQGQDNYFPAATPDPDPPLPLTPNLEEGGFFIAPPGFQYFWRDNPSGPAKPTGQELAARHLYQVGVKCLLKGDLDMAANCFEETHLLAPQAEIGRRATDRLEEVARLKARTNDASEAQDAPPQETPARTEPGKLSAAWKLYRIGERCRRRGELDMAVNCFHEVRLLCPHHPLAELAAWRTDTVRAKRAAAEESDDDSTPEAPHNREGEYRRDGLRPVPPVGSPDTTRTPPPNHNPWRLEILEQSSAPGVRRPQGKSGDKASAPVRLYVCPPAQRLTLEEEPSAPLGR
jgi:hypothetical protein